MTLPRATARMPLFTMLSVAEALKFLREQVPTPSREGVGIENAYRRVLAEDVASDIDLPPFHRSMMDGYAVRSGEGEGLLVVEEIPAGKMPAREVGAGECSKIMTGAPLPAGADAVQQVEKTRREGDRVHLLEPVDPGKNVAKKGEDLKVGDRVLSSGKILLPAEVGILATVGKTSLSVFRRPSVAILVTGDEIVEPGEPCSGARIRNANGPFLRAQCEALGLETSYLGIARDREEALRERIRDGLKKDVLIITGGVSAGDWDLVIPCLKLEGVSHQFHKVAVKPGKPLYFGTRGRTRIFGLPGNPVSSFVSFEVFLRPFLGWMMGGDLSRPRMSVSLRGTIARKADRERYLPGAFDGATVTAVRWNGSGDLSGMAGANCLINIPVGTMYRDGDLVDILLLT